MAKHFNSAHASDEDLLAYLDGEVPTHKGWLIRRHLEGCWKCRASASQLEKGVHAVTTLIEADHFPTPERVASAQARLMGRLWRLSPRPGTIPERGRRHRWWLAAATAAAILLFFVPRRHTTTTTTVPPRAPQAQALLAEVALAEEAVVHRLSAHGSVHQTFRVFAVQMKPAYARRESRLEVWADPSRGRFTARWQDASGTLRHALWRPDRTRSYSYTSDGPRTVRVIHTAHADRSIPDLDGHGLSLDALEHAFLRWLETRPWTSVALAAGLRRFVSADGATLVAETARDGLRLRATRNIEGGRIVFELLTENESRRPRLQRVTWERYGRVFELQLVQENEATAVRASFEPDRRLFSRPAPEIPPPPPMEKAPPKEDLVSLQIQAMYVLHKLNVCLGEGVELTREENAVVVRGVVGTPERQDQIVSALTALSQAHPLRVEIESTNEAMARLGGRSAGLPTRTLVAAKLAADPASPSPHPWCKGKTVKTCAQARARVLGVAETLVAEAAELRNLQRLRLAAASHTAVSADSERLIDLMARAHAEGLRGGTTRLWQLLGEFTPDPGWVPSLLPPASPSDSQHLYTSARDISHDLREMLAEGSEGDATTQARRTVAAVSAFQAVLESVSNTIESRLADASRTR